MYSSLYEFLSLKFITQSPFNHRASFVFMITACMMSGTGVHWCQTKIKFGFKSLEILQKHEVSDCAIEHTVEKPDLHAVSPKTCLFFSRHTFIPPITDFANLATFKRCEKHFDRSAAA